MAYTGTLVKSVASTGFGFIQRNDGEGNVFVHFSQLMNGGSDDMLVGSSLTFDLGIDDQRGRLQALNVHLTETGAKARGNGSGGCGGASGSHGKVGAGSVSHAGVDGAHRCGDETKGKAVAAAGGAMAMAVLWPGGV